MSYIGGKWRDDAPGGRLTSTNPADDPVALGDYIARNIQPEVQRIRGVGQAQLFGSERAMRIWIDPAKLVSFGLSPADVNSAIRAQNAQVSAGTLGDVPGVPGQPMAATIVVNGQLANVAQFSAVVLRASADGSTVRLRDVARIELGGQGYGSFQRLNGQPAAGIALDVKAVARIVTTSRKRMVGGFYTYDNQTSLKELGSVCSGKSDARGLLLCEAMLGEPGEIELVVTAKDKDGHSIQAASSVYVTRQGELWFRRREP